MNDHTTARRNSDLPRFDGSDYQPPRDDVRLSKQYQRLFDLMRNGHWRTLREIAERTGDPEASVSAQLRHFRKPRFGGHTVEKEYWKNGLYFYRLIVRQPGDIVEQPERKPHCATCTCGQPTEVQLMAAAMEADGQRRLL